MRHQSRRPLFFTTPPSPPTGRVNYIGEHIDYEGYDVLPAAILQDTKVAAAAAADGVIQLINLDRAAYPDLTFPADPAAPMPEKHSWGSYFLAAYKGVSEYCAAKSIPFNIGGLRVVVHGTVPLGSGLSSSAALVCASALALLGVAGVEASKNVRGKGGKKGAARPRRVAPPQQNQTTHHPPLLPPPLLFS